MPIVAAPPQGSPSEMSIPLCSIRSMTALRSRPTTFSPLTPSVFWRATSRALSTSATNPSAPLRRSTAVHPARSGLKPRGELGQASFALLSPSPSRSPRYRCGCGPNAVNRARTSVVAETAGAQAPPPSQAPCQPANRDPGAAFGLRVTFVPTGNDCSQSPGQLIPAGSLETSPPPSTVTRRFAVFEGGGGGGGPPGRSMVQRCVSRAV